MKKCRVQLSAPGILQNYGYQKLLDLIADHTTDGCAANGAQSATAGQDRTCYAAYTCTNSRMLLLAAHTAATGKANY